MRQSHALVLATLLALPAHAEFYAAQLTDANLDKLPDGGMDAIGGRGDWLLTDGTLCAVISGEEHTTYFNLTGAALVDLWHCELGNDQWSSVHTQFNLQKEQIPETTDIRAGYDKDHAWVETEGIRNGLVVRTRYALVSGSEEQLHVGTAITRTNEGDALGMLGSLILHPSSALAPYTLDLAEREFSIGFNQPDVDTTDFGSVLSSLRSADLQVLVGSPHITPSVSYGVHTRGAILREPDGDESPLHLFQLGASDFSMIGVITQPFPGWWSRTPGAVSLGLAQLFDLDEGATLTLHQNIHVGSRSDVAVITDRFYTGNPVTMAFDTRNVAVNVTDTEGRALTHARADEAGRVSFTLPAGIERAKVTARTPWDRYEQEIEAKGPTDLGDITLGTPTIVQLPRGETMSLTFRRAEGPQAVFNDNLFYDSFFDDASESPRRLRGAESPRVDLAGTPLEPSTVALPRGRYTVYATRGPEFSVTQSELVLTGDTATLDIAPPQRVLATPGMVNADFHLHSGLSFDASLSPEQRVIDFVAQGGEVLTSTEHNVTYDIAPVVADLGLADTVLTLAGVEITGMVRTRVAPRTIAHSNVFPVPEDTQAFMGGTLPFENRRLGQVIGDYKARHPGSVYQLNHAREAARDDDLAFFNHLSQGESYDSGKSLAEAPNNYLTETLPGTEYRDIDFDAMELLNGKSYDLYEVLREDWFSLLKQNYYKVATANSDSHKSSTIAAYPRNMLVVEDDTVAELSEADVVAALTSGRLYGTTGPMLSVSLEGRGPGETLTGTGGELVITAECADWVTVDEARVWVNGELVKTLPITSGTPVRLPIEVATDSFIFVEVEGAAEDVYAAILPGFHPFAFANPVFVDTGGDGWRFGEP